MSGRRTLDPKVLKYFTTRAAAARSDPGQDVELLHSLLMADARDLGWWAKDMEVLMALCLAKDAGADAKAVADQLNLLEKDVKQVLVVLARQGLTVSKSSPFRASKAGRALVGLFLETGNARLGDAWLGRQLTGRAAVR